MSNGLQLICLHCRSHSEYLVRNRVQAAYQQDLVLQGVNCVLYKYAMFIVKGVQTELYRMYSLYHTGCAVCIEHKKTSEKKRGH